MRTSHPPAGTGAAIKLRNPCAQAQQDRLALQVTDGPEPQRRTQQCNAEGVRGGRLHGGFVHSSAAPDHSLHNGQMAERAARPDRGPVFSRARSADSFVHREQCRARTPGAFAQLRGQCERLQLAIDRADTIHLTARPERRHQRRPLAHRPALLELPGDERASSSGRCT